MMMRRPKFMPPVPPRRAPSPSPDALTPALRIAIDQEGETRWELVGGGPVWMVERIGPAGEERLPLEAFEATEDGRRLANSLTVALARTPQG